MNKKMMKNGTTFAIAASLSIIFAACGSLENDKYDVKSDGFEKAMEHLEKIPGGDVMADELRFSFNDSVGDKNNMIDIISVEFQSKSDKNQLERMTYNPVTGWSAINPVEINPDGDCPEVYELDEEINTLSLVKADVLKKVYEEAIRKAAEQQIHPLMSNILVNFKKGKDVTYETSVRGSLKNSGEFKLIYFVFDKDGNLEL
ncbi:MAG: hypothetical protein FWF54_05190 [Candidatus Azobacteroides sp.]|nr:hypothetical protein [Candidatus Azobacteroides sp.]